MVVAGLIAVSADPKLVPVALVRSSRDMDAMLARLSRDDPTTPGQDGSNLERGEPLSDHAVFSDWLTDDARPVAFTVGGAIHAERPRSVLRLAQQEAERKRRLAEVAAFKAQVQASRRAEQAQVEAENAALSHQREVAAAQSAIAGAAQARTVACNTARAHAYGKAASATAFIAWVRAHPCPEGTDIGDGYWNVAR